MIDVDIEAKESRGEDAFSVYALKCADGTAERHPLDHRTMRNLAMLEMVRLNKREMSCGPHTLLTAKVSRSPWVEVVDLNDLEPLVDPVAVALQLKTAPLAYACPRCGADVGARCENLTERRKGRVELTIWPHPARTELWSAAG